MYDYHKMGTNALRGLLNHKANRYNKIRAGQLRKRRPDEEQVLEIQMRQIRAILYARENNLRLEGF